MKPNDATESEGITDPPVDWGRDPTLITFFVPLLQPLGLVHGSTYTLWREEIVPWLAGVPVFVKEHLAPIGSEEGHSYVSLMVWRPKETFELLTRPLDAAALVMRVVTGVEGDPLSEGLRETVPAPVETAGTVISAVTPLVLAADQDLEQGISDAFDRCLEELGLLVRSYAVQADDLRVPFLSRRNVYPVVLYALREVAAESLRRQELGVFLAHEGVGLLPGPPPEMDRDGVQVLMTSLSRLKQGDPFHVASEQMYRARRAYRVEGDYAGAVSAAHTAGEVLLNTVLLLVEWEKGTPREATRRWFEEEGFTKRLRSYYHPSLGGNWNPDDGRGVIGRWHRLGELRGRVVHAGHLPSEDDVREALDAMARLVDFVKDRLVARRNAFPRTALLLLGEPGLRRRNAWGGAIERFVREESSREPPWIASFRAWMDGTPPPPPSPRAGS